MERVTFTKSELERLNVVEKLQRLLSLAKAEITARKVAAIVQLNDGSETYGFNTEGAEFVHAERRALVGAKENLEIISVHLMAGGSRMDIKNAVPCEACAALIAKSAKPDTKVILYFNDGSGSFNLPLKTIQEGYLPFSDIPGPPTEHPISFLRNTTLMTEADINVTAEMMRSFLKYNSSFPEHPVHVYLTGSSSGRGGPKSLLAEEITGVPYWDIDLLVLFPEETSSLNLDEMLKEIYLGALIKCGFAYSKIFSREVWSYIKEMGLKSDSKDFYFRRIYWCEGMSLEIQPPDYKKDPKIPSTLDISVGKSLEVTITPGYLKRKQLVQLV